MTKIKSNGSMLLVYGIEAPKEITKEFSKKYKLAENASNFFVRPDSPIIGLIFDNYTEHFVIDTTAMNSWNDELQKDPDNMQIFVHFLEMWSGIIKSKSEELNKIEDINSLKYQQLKNELDELDMPEDLTFNWYVVCNHNVMM